MKIFNTIHIFFLQITTSFNDWTATGVEKETNLAFRAINKARDEAKEMFDYATIAEANASSIHLSSRTEINDKTTRDLNAVAAVAQNAGYTLCAVKARSDASTIVVKYQYQVHTSKDVFMLASYKVKSPALVARNTFGLYDRNADSALFRGCDNLVNRQFANWVSNCYKVIMVGLTGKYKTVTRLMEPLYRDYATAKNAYVEYQAAVDRAVAGAATDTAKAVEEAKRCANLNRNPSVQVTSGEVAALNATASDYLKTNTGFLETSINGLQSQLNKTKASVNTNVSAAIQPFLSVGKYLKPFGLTGENDANLSKQINNAVENTSRKTFTLITDKIKTLNDFLDDVRSISGKYKLDLSYVTESNLTNLCVPKDAREQIAKEEEIKKCVRNLFRAFSDAVQLAKDKISKKITDFNSTANDVSNFIQVQIPTEIKSDVEKLNLNLTSLLKSYRYDPSLFLEITEKHFSLPKYQNIIKNQIGIKDNLGKMKLLIDSVEENLDFEVESAVGQLPETIEIIKILNPNYNLSALYSALFKFKKDLKNKIITSLDGKYANAVNLTAPWLSYDLDAELNALLRNGEKCFPAELVQLIGCLEPLTVKFENALTKYQSLNVTTDTDNVVRKLPNEIQQLKESAINDVKKQVKTLSLDALDSANPGTDFRKETIVEFQNVKEKKIKIEARTSIEAANQFYLDNKINFEKFRLDVENIYRNLRLAYEKNYKLVPNQSIPWSVRKSEIDKKINTYLENIKSQINIYLDGGITQNLKVIINETSHEFIAFVINLVKSNCTKLINQKSLFTTCIQDIYKRYNLNLDTAENRLKVIANDMKSVFTAGLKQIEDLKAKELKTIEQEVKMEIGKIEANQEDNNNSAVNQCIQETKKRINTEILTKTSQLFKATAAFQKELTSLKFVSRIANTLSTWWSTIDFTFKLNSRNAAKLNAEKERFNKYRTDAVNRANSEVQVHLNKIRDIETETNTLINELKSIDLKQSCASDNATNAKFQQCIAQQCAKLNIDIDSAARRVDELSTIVVDLKSSAKKSIENAITEEIRKAEDLSKLESEKLVKENNITASQIISTALGDFAKFNVTPLTQVVQIVRVTANNLHEYALRTNKSANDMLNRLNILLNLHVYAASTVCSKVSTKNENDFGSSRIQSTIDLLHSLFPNMSDYVSSQFQLANGLNATLQSEISKLSSAGQSCDSRDLYKLVECLNGAAELFRQYFENATEQIEIVRTESLEQYKNRTVQLDNWKGIDVNQEYDKLKKELQPIPEAVYIACNVTKDKLLDFAVTNMNNRKNKFNISIPNTVQSVIAAGNNLLATNYSGVVNLSQSLQEPVKFIRVAIGDVLASKNATQITAQIRLEPDRLVGVGVQRSDKFIADLYVTARQSIQLAQSLRVQADELHKNTNRSSAEAACFDPKSEYPLSYFVVCNNEYNYQYEVKLQNINKQLDLALATLQNINTNGRQLIINNSNDISADIKTQSAEYAIYLYFTAGLPRPTYLDPFVKDGCLVRINGDPRNTCIVFS